MKQLINFQEKLNKFLKLRNIILFVLIVLVRPLQAQTLITGTVINSNNEPIPYLNVVIKGTQKGTMTDINGKYSINVPANDSVLIFSFVGYQTTEEKLKGQTTMDVLMKDDVVGMDEVVVVGYGTQKKKELTSAISNVDASSFNQGAVDQSPIQLVQGKIPGLAISSANGSDPNKPPQIQMRGVSSLAGNLSPLVIIDGVPQNDLSTLNTISPEDIASFDVLRDGSAAAIYGTRGTNGVILVTTKKGKTGAPVFEYSSYVYNERIAKSPDILSASKYKQTAAEYVASKNKTLLSIGKAMQSSQIDQGASTDWMKEITQSPFSQVHNFSVSGGNESSKYYASVNYRGLNGIVKKSDNNILSGHLNVNTTGFHDKLNIQASLTGTIDKFHPTDSTVYQQAFQMSPLVPVKYTSGPNAGMYAEEAGQQEIINPVMMLNTAINDQQIITLVSNFRATLELLPGLKISTMGALQNSEWSQGYYETIDRWYGGDLGSNPYHGVAVRNWNETTDRTSETTINYGKLIAGNNFNLLAGYSYEDNVFEGFGARNYNFINDDFTYNNLNAGLHLNPLSPTYNPNDVNSNKYSSTLIAFFGRVIWSYNEKYLATLSFRKEGSSKFGANNKWAMFPAITAGWVINKEDFMKNIEWISELKLRAGWGQTGNQGVNPYQSLLTYSNGNPVLYQGQYYSSLTPNNNNNPNLKWETKTETDLGIDFGVLQNKIVANFDIYNRVTTNMLWQFQVGQPQFIGSTYWDNVGKMQNRGIELGLTVIPVNTNDFNWTSNFNISYNANKVVTIAGGTIKIDSLENKILGSPGLSTVDAYRLEDGQPVGNMFGYVYAGLDSVGNWQFWNKAHTKKLSATQVTHADKQVIGNGLPKYWLGFTNSFAFKGFDLSFLLRGAFGFDILNTQRLFYANKTLLPKNVLNEAISSSLSPSASPVFSSYYVENGNYLKIDNLTFGYTFPINKKILQKARLYFSTTNLYTFTKYKGMDPEVGIQGMAPGFDSRAVYPTSRIFTLGANITF